MKNEKKVKLSFYGIVFSLSLCSLFLFPGVSYANPSMSEHVQDYSSGCYRSGEDFYLYEGYSGCYVMIATYWSGWATDPGYILNVNDARILTLPPIAPGVGQGNGAAYWLWVPYGGFKSQMRTYFDGTELLTHNRSVYCSSGLVWNGYSCVRPVTNGVCGAANGAYLTDPPMVNLCSSGNPSAWGQWSWSCSGTNGGSPAYCSANPIPKGGAAVDCSNVAAWTCDASNYAQSLDVHLWEHGISPPWWDPSKFRGFFTANQDWHNPWVNIQCGGYGNHVGTLPVPISLKDGNWHTLSAYAIDTPSPPKYNPNIGNMSFNCSLPVTGLTATCNPEGTQATFAWNHTSGYIYAARLDGGTDSAWWWDGMHSVPWPCGFGKEWWLPLMPPPFQGDYCGTTLNNSFVANVTPGVNNVFWVHRYNGGTAWTDPTLISINCPPKPAVELKASVRDGAFTPTPPIAHQEDKDKIKFQWNSTNATSCAVINGFNKDNIFKTPLSLLPAGTTDSFLAGDEVKGQYRMVCKDAANKESNPATVDITVKCHPTDWLGWGDCDKSCDGGKQLNSRRMEDCSYQTQTRDCNMQACQPDGFQEVTP